MLRIKKEYLYISFILLMIAGIYGYGIVRIYGMSVYPDEFGYWASAASLVGWDWSQIASLGSYYSFGYSLILFPILKFTPDSVIAYRVAVSVNVIFLCIAFFLLMGMAGKLFPEGKKEFRIFSGAVALLYPAWLFYMQTTLTEAMLIFMVILVVSLLVRLIARPRMITGILLALAAVYAYTLHLRAVGVVIACGMTLCLWGIFNSKIRKKIFIFLGIIILTVMATFIWKEIVQQSVYSEGSVELLNGNDYGGQLERIKALFTLPGIRNFCVNIAGKFLYMGFSTGGLAYWGIGWCLVQIKGLAEAFRERTQPSTACWAGVFLLLLTLGQLMICGIYTIGAADPDWIIYGRYIELLIPILMFMGLCNMHQCKRLFRRQMIVLSIYSVMAAICLWACRDMDISRIRGEHSVVTSILIGDGNVFPKVFFGQVWLVGILISLIVAGLMWYTGQKQNRIWLFGLLILMEVMIGIGISHSRVYISNQNMRMDLAMVDVLKEREDLTGDILFLREGSEKWIGFLQMQLRERSIQVVEAEEIEQLDVSDTSGTAMLVYYNSDYLDELSELYDQRVMADVYYVFY